MSFLSKLFGSNVKPATVNYSTPGFIGGGLVGQLQGNDYVVGADANRQGAVGNVASNFGALGDKLGGLADTVGSGFNDLLKARLSSIDNSASSAIGDLRQNLQARRVLGSSFGQDTLTRAGAEFSQQRDAATADTFLKSLQASTALITQQYDAYNKQFQTGLSELNLEGQLASSLSSSTASILAQNAQARAKINESAAEQNAKTNAGIAGGLGKFIGGFIPSGGFFGGGGTTDVPGAAGGGVLYTGDPSMAGFGPTYNR